MHTYGDIPRDSEIQTSVPEYLKRQGLIDGCMPGACTLVSYTTRAVGTCDIGAYVNRAEERSECFAEAFGRATTPAPELSEHFRKSKYVRDRAEVSSDD